MRRSWVGVASELGWSSFFGFRKGRKIFFKKCVCNPHYTTTVLYAKKEEIYPAYVSKHNLNHEKQVILLMISNGEKLREAKSEG